MDDLLVVRSYVIPQKLVELVRRKVELPKKVQQLDKEIEENEEEERRVRTTVVKEFEEKLNKLEARRKETPEKKKAEEAKHAKLKEAWKQELQCADFYAFEKKYYEWHVSSC